MFVPGILLSFALLKGLSLSRLDKTLIGVILGVVLLPLIGFLEFELLGIQFSGMLALVNVMLLALAGLAALWKQGQLSKIPTPKIQLDVPGLKEFLKNNWAEILLLAIILSAFWVRFATSWSSNFFEFDPYYYNKLAEKVVLHGSVDLYSPESYYPNQAFQHFAPLTYYTVSSWYSLYRLVLGLAYSKDTLILAAGFYPPLVAALSCFLAFVIVREEYDKYLALIPAAMLAYTPQILVKTAAGVSEQQPWGMFSVAFVFAAYLLAIGRKSWRLAILSGIAAVAAVLGSQQYIWPLAAVAAYIVLRALLDFIAGRMDEQAQMISGVFIGFVVLSSLVLSSYQNGVLTPYINSPLLLIVSAYAFSLALFGLSKFVSFSSAKERVTWGAAAIALTLVVVMLSPLRDVTLGYLSMVTSFAKSVAPLGFTIQEEGASTPVLASYFGVLGQFAQPLLAAVALLAAASAVVMLLLKGKRRYAAIFGGGVAILVFLNAQIDGILSWFAGATGSADLASAVTFFSQNDVFLYMLIAIASLAVSYVWEEKGNKMLLLFVLAFFPVAFIGMSKVKYTFHLGIALCFFAGFVLGETKKLIENLNTLTGFSKDHVFVSNAAFALLMCVGIVAVFVQAQTVGPTMEQLRGTRIPEDWTATFDWMRTSLPKDARVMSWWDYGHWTTFLGERNTVLDPNNAYPYFDQGVARAFVNGGTANLYDRMNYHHADYIMVDWELISKWGALVFLSGACDSSMSPVCPQVADITN
ncbi:MAG: STT3 domain-containing protein, partial [Candidatus Micrarchaeota archaeon]